MTRCTTDCGAYGFAKASLSESTQTTVHAYSNDLRLPAPAPRSRTRWPAFICSIQSCIRRVHHYSGWVAGGLSMRPQYAVKRYDGAMEHTKISRRGAFAMIGGAAGGVMGATRLFAQGQGGGAMPKAPTGVEPGSITYEDV